MMVHQSSDRFTGARRATPDPSYAELRARLLLAQSILNHRATPDGLSRDDAAAVAGALAGLWDAA